MRRGSKSTSARYGAGFWGLLNGGQVFKISVFRRERKNGCICLPADTGMGTFSRFPENIGCRTQRLMDSGT